MSPPAVEEDGPASALVPIAPPIRVSKFQPEEWEDDEPTLPVELQREHRWKLLRRLYFILHSKRYRLRDLESALWKVSNGPIASDVFVCIIMSKFRFEKRMAVDKLLYRVYRAFDGAETGAVDWRDVLASLVILRENKAVRANAVHVLESLFHLYMDTSSRQSVDIQHLERLFRIPSVTEREVSSADERLRASLADVAPTYGYKRRPWHVPKRMFLDMVGQHKALVGVFRRQAWARLAEDMRLAILSANEDKSAFNFEAENDKYLTKRAIKLYHFMLRRRTYNAWKLFISWVLKVRNYRDLEMEKRMRRSLRWWHARLRSLKRSRLKQGAAAALGEKCIKLRIIRRMQQWNVRKEVIKKVNLPYKEDNRWFMEGLRYLRESWESYKKRVAFRMWFEHAWMDVAMELAEQHYRTQMLRRNFAAAKSYLQASAKQFKRRRQEEKQREENQKFLLDAMEEVRRELERQEEEERRIEEERKRKEQEERMRQKAWEAQKHMAEKQANERHKLQAQADARNARVLALKQQLRDEHTTTFQKRLDVETAEAREQVESWFDFMHQPTLVGRDIVQREFKLLSARFFAPPRVGEESREVVLTSPANIIFVYIDVVLNSQNMTLSELFRAYDLSGSGYMSHEDFMKFMKSLPLPLGREQIKDIIEKVDVSGDGYVDLEELESAQKRALEALGEPTSPWKMYVDPAQSVMCYHNILTDEKVYDFKMTENKLLEILHDNLIASEVAKVKDKILEEEPIAWYNVVQNYCASVIQKQYRRYRAWRQFKDDSWRVQIRIRHEQEKLQEEAGDVIRRCAIKMLARRELRYLARICFEKNIDPASGEAYYINYNNGVSQWTKPKLLRRPDEDVTLAWCTAYKPGDPSGQAYFYRPETGTWSDEKPDGYLLCDVCRYNLAFRQCNGAGCEGYRYCFGCFHRYHVHWSMRMSRGDHEGVLMQPVSCVKCSDRLACRSCAECNEVMCKQCFNRIHRNPLVAHHTWTVVG